tara:strand:+ start:1074903 stop:1076366 length:1464 start_codon:yes stop_codon:yes gene_type:complete
MNKDFSCISPIDDEIVWSGTETSAADVRRAMQKSAAAASSWRETDVQQRIEIVQQFAGHLERHRDDVAHLISREVGKLTWDAQGEVAAAIAKADLSIQALQQRRSDQVPPAEPAGDSATLTRAVRYQPIGVALVLGPFNFPLHLPGGQIIPALLAGNTVVFKPSDQATAVGRWIADAWNKVGLPPDVLQLIVGGVDTAIAAIDAPEVAGVFLTGSRAAGRAIHRQLAGRPEVLLALELGGNNPIVVSDEVDAEVAASIVSFSAFVSAGQRCTCARRAIYVHNQVAPQSGGLAQFDALIRATEALRVGLPEEPDTQIGPLISRSAADSLHETYDRLVQLGCEPLAEWRVDPRRENLVFPSILDASKISEEAFASIGEMEWFGPLLVVRVAKDLDKATHLAAQTPYGLAASLLGGDQHAFETFVQNVGAGVVNWNRATTGAAGTLPFGGRGHSGNHRPAGFYAIDFCNEPISSLQLEHPDTSDPWSVTK